MAGIGVGFAALSTTKKIGVAVGALIVLALLVLLILNKIEERDQGLIQQGRDEVDRQWKEASDQLNMTAQESATKADDRAAARLEEAREQAAEDRKAVDDATRNGTSPLDALFGG